MYIVEFDYCAILLLAIMLFSVVYRKMTQGTANRIFIVFIIICLLNTFFDIMSVYQYQSDVSMTVWYGLYYTVRAFTAPTYLLLLFAITDGWNCLEGKLKAALYYLPLLIAFVFIIIINPRTGCIFSIENGQLISGPLKWILYAMGLIYILESIIYICRYIRFFARNKILAIITIIPVTFSAIVMQALYPHWLIEMFAQACCLLFYSISIQKPEERIYEDTNIFQRYSFQEDMRLAEFNNQKIALCIFKIKSFNSRIEAVNYEASEKLIYNISQKLNAIVHQEKIYGTIYYLTDGCFVVALQPEFRDRAMELATTISEMLNDDRIRKDIVNSKLEVYECVVRLPEEIGDYVSLQALVDNVQDLLPTTDYVYNVKDIAGNRHFHLLTEMETIIDRALKYKEFEVYYQPLYSAEQKRVNSAEALLRLNDPKYGFINPELIVTTAEKSGSIHQLGRVVYDEVCRFMASDIFEKLGIDHIEVNLSVEQFKDRQLCDKLIRVTDDYGVEASRINFEITETAMSDTWEEVVDQINTLKECGFGRSLDDFGQKNSNLKRLSSLPLQYAKLDKDIVQSINSPKGRTILKSTVAMLKGLGLSIVAEGIENREMAKQMLDIGCDYLQGYYFSQALPQEKFVEYVIKEGHNVI